MTSKSISTQKRVSALRIKALCSILVKLTNQDIEKRLAQADIKINTSALVPLRILQFRPMTLQELSKLIIVAPATLIPVIDELETKGLITRKTETNDRRKKLLHSTVAGTKLMKRIIELNSKNKFIKSVCNMPLTESARLIAYLEHLVTDVSGTDTLCERIASNVCKQLPPDKNTSQLSKSQIKSIN